MRQPSCEGDTRPISLTAVLVKILEDFVVQSMLEDIGQDIDTNQFGSLKGSSTTYCLLDMVHNWLAALNNPGKYIRTCFFDFARLLTGSTITLWYKD